MSAPLLEVRGLTTVFETRGARVPAVAGVSFDLRRGEVLGIVGESGSGKSVTAYSILGLVAPPGRVSAGSARFAGEDLLRAPRERLRALRGDRIAMIFQDPSTSLNPVLTVGTQIAETIRAHRDVGRAQARALAKRALVQVGIAAPEERLDAYPHELSGGMRQRLGIAIALVNEPDLVLADEPTTALDVTIQAQILHLVRDLCARRGTALIWISHDLAVVSTLAHRILVMYAGRVVEDGPADAVLDRPRHPYTAGLISSIASAGPRGARLRPIPGMAPDPTRLPAGCVFKARCERRGPDCETPPHLRPVEPGRSASCHRPIGEAAA